MKRRLDELASRLDLGARELASLAEPVLPAPVLPERGGSLRARLRGAIGQRVRRAIEEDLRALRESIHVLDRALKGVDLASAEAANDAARALAATLAALRRYELGASMEAVGEEPGTVAAPLALESRGEGAAQPLRDAPLRARVPADEERRARA
jgi:hypothetical protein